MPQDSHDDVVQVAERMLDAAPGVGVDLLHVEMVRRRLAANQDTCWVTPPSARRMELERAVYEDIQTLCQVFLQLRGVQKTFL